MLSAISGLTSYAVIPRGVDLAEYGRELAIRDGIIPKTGLLADCFDSRAYAETYMKQHGLSVTEHGYAAWNGGDLIFEYSQPKQGPFQTMGMM